MTLTDIQAKAQEEFNKEFPHKIAEVIDDFGSTTKPELKFFLDSYVLIAYTAGVKEGREAVVREVLEKLNQYTCGKHQRLRQLLSEQIKG